MSNVYCEALGIEPPVLDNVVGHRNANTYALLIVALLERGGPSTLAQVADRLVRAGVGTSGDVTLSLQRCKPARAPVYREGDLYALDVHDDELTFRLRDLGLRPPASADVARSPAVVPASESGGSPTVVEAWEARRAAHAAELAALHRAIVHVFPAKAPVAVTIADVGARTLVTLVGAEVIHAVEHLAPFESIAGVDIRALLRGLGFDPGGRLLAELGPPQKSKKITKGGRQLKITTAMLIAGTCGISRPLADSEVLAGYVRDGATTKLRRRMEADAKALVAFYEYGRLHKSVRLRWGFLDELLPAPWVHHDEVGLYQLEKQAAERGTTLDVVVGSAPGWADPWSRARRVSIVPEGRYGLALVDEGGSFIDQVEVQAARHSAPAGE